jgi:hypothetical protein
MPLGESSIIRGCHSWTGLSQALVELRDWLLSTLVNGQVTVA